MLVYVLASQPLAAQDFIVGESGWQLERLSDHFVLLRTDIQLIEPKDRSTRRGLLILTCERQARRIRFQIADAPGKPSTQFSQLGRAILRGERDGKPLGLTSVSPRVRFFEDGSFEFLEAIGFSDPVMRDFLHLLQQVPNRLEVVFFKGPETGAFVRGTARRFNIVRLDEGLGSVYGFEGLCFRAPR